MTAHVDTLRGIAAPEDRWDEGAADLGVLDGLVYRSNLLGADRALANVGGGNTSAKETIADHTGREVRVLWVKGSGTDLATITSTGFAGLRLDELLPLRGRDAMDDAEMVEYLLRCAIRPDQPRPSIETLLHAFVGADHVDHTHPDAVIALTSTPDGRTLAEEAFGDEAVWLDYQRPGFDMSRRIAELLEEQPEARAVLLERHGLVTWGATGEESYRATLEFVRRAAEAIDRAAKGGFGLGGRKVEEVSDRDAAALLSQSLPALRGALAADADGVILEVDRSPEAVAFASSDRRAEGQPGRRALPRPPDPHEAQAAGGRLRSGERTAPPSFARPSGRRGGVRATGTAPTTSATSTTRRGSSRSTRTGPRVVLVPGVGIVTTGAGRRRGRGSPATSTTGRSPSRTPPTRSAASGR